MSCPEDFGGCAESCGELIGSGVLMGVFAGALDGGDSVGGEFLALSHMSVLAYQPCSGQ